MILSILLLFLITIGGCNKKQTEYLTDPIAIVYKMTFLILSIQMMNFLIYPNMIALFLILGIF